MPYRMYIRYMHTHTRVTASLITLGGEGLQVKVQLPDISTDKGDPRLSCIWAAGMYFLFFIAIRRSKWTLECLVCKRDTRTQTQTQLLHTFTVLCRRYSPGMFANEGAHPGPRAESGVRKCNTVVVQQHVPALCRS